MSVGRIEIRAAVDFGRVAVMLGGTSPEREVSLDSGRAVLEALRSRGVDAVAWDSGERDLAQFARENFDRVWNALHGTGGEDGVLQGALTALNVPYTGSGVLASALAMDKARSKQMFAAAGVPTPEFVVVKSLPEALAAADRFDYPLIVKPCGQGSSVGMSKVDAPADLRTAIQLALEFGDRLLIERYVAGAEVTVSVLQGDALPSIRVETPREFYDYHAKYEANSTRYTCPATDDPQQENGYADLALRAFDVLGCSGWGRVDFMHARGEAPQVLEVNTVPGMTSHSLVPMAAKASGFDFAELCWRILETSFTAHPQVALAEVANGA